MIIKVVVVFLLFVSIANAHSLSYQYSHFSKQQIEVLKQSCEAGKPYNLCLTLASIAWHESDAGLWQINLQDPGAGIYNVKISTAMSRIKPKLRNTPFNRNRVAMWLIDYPKLAAKIAIYELKDWMKYWHGDWYRAVGSYNGGTKWNKKYAKDIAKKVRFLKKHIRF